MALLLVLLSMKTMFLTTVAVGLRRILAFISGITDYKTSLVVGEEKLSIEYPIPSPSPIDIEI